VEVPQAEEWPPYCDPSYSMPLVISIKVPGPDGGMQNLMVSVDKATERKAYLGGYRHKATGAVFHHAASQTPAGLENTRGWKNPEMKNHRDTQTYDVKTRSQMTTREHGTQMKRNDLYMDDAGDVQKESRPYFSAVQLDELKRRKTLVIQCYYRGYLARKRVWAMREHLYQRWVDEQERVEREKEEREKKRQHEIERRAHPKSAKDFELLYNELEDWVQKEVRQMKGMGLAAEEKKQRMAEILAKQTKALQTIDKLKAEALREGKATKVGKMLGMMAQPKRWELGNGEVQEVHTPFTVRAAELRELYHALNSFQHGGLDERLEVLLNIKWTAKEFDCRLTRDIIELCDREAEMLHRGRKESTLAGLRQRLSNLFLQFIETPDFNPESERFQSSAALGQRTQGTSTQAAFSATM